MKKNNFNFGGQTTPMIKKDPGHYVAPVRPKLQFQMPKPESKTPNMDSLRKSGGVVNKQNSDAARNIDRTRNNKSFGRGWGG